MSHFIVRSGNIYANMVTACKQVLTDPVHPTEVIIRPYVEDKTREQRNWWHKLCGLIGDESGYTKDEIKQIIKARLYGVKEITIGGMTLVVPAVHTEKLSRKRYSELIDATYQYAGDAGIVLPPPECRDYEETAN